MERVSPSTVTGPMSYRLVTRLGLVALRGGGGVGGCAALAKSSQSVLSLSLALAGADSVLAHSLARQRARIPSGH